MSTQTVKDDRSVQLSRFLNMAALVALLAVVLGGSLHLQFGLGEQPCPLCLVQRSAMIGLAVGPVMNLLLGIRPMHYAISILAAVVGSAGSIRQILLHILPGDPGYGPTVLGMHLYTWAFITFAIAIAGCALLLMWDRPFAAKDQGLLGEPGVLRLVALALTTWVLLDLLIIGIWVLPECGLGMCPDDPLNTPSLGSVGGWILVFGIAAVSFIIGAVLNRRLPALPRS